LLLIKEFNGYGFLYLEPVTLFCGNLDPDLTAETLQGFFEASGVDVSNPRKIGVKRYYSLFKLSPKTQLTVHEPMKNIMFRI